MIAEGVETKEQMNKLIDIKCDGIQGYYIGRPIKEKEFEDTFLKIKKVKKANSI